MNASQRGCYFFVFQDFFPTNLGEATDERKQYGQGQVKSRMHNFRTHIHKTITKGLFFLLSLKLDRIFKPDKIKGWMRHLQSQPVFARLTLHIQRFPFRESRRHCTE